MSGKQIEKPQAHIGQASIVIGSLAIVLAAGLAVVGLLDRMDPVLADLMRSRVDVAIPKAVPDWLLWVFTAFAAYGLAFVLLSVSGGWRRWILWITSLALVLLWAPILSLASHEPRTAAPLVTVLWSGICAFVYVGNHRMPEDD